MYFVYILKSKKIGQLYVGYTPDLKRRLTRHNAGKVKSTKAYIPWVLVYYSAFENERLAKNFEHYLKTGSGRAFQYKRLVLKPERKTDS